jgi:DNA polymerase-3 subunit gamma/tau
MTQALYRKWRPLAWDEVVSQEHIIQTLKNAVAGDRVAHAYLFSGPRGTGKTTAARLLAKAVNCLDEDVAKRPCNQCAHCVAVNENRFMDLIEIDAASNTSVEDVRDLRDKINFAPSQGRYKVYIIDEVHMLSTAAFNALLKTLEEPPPHAIFILATTENHKIPATVLSRCQRHEFRRFPLGEITRRLNDICKAEAIQADPDALTLIARQSSGGMRDAISLLDQLASTGGKITLETAQTVLGTATNQSVIGLIQAVVDKQPAQGLNEIHRALDGGADARALARQVVEYLRGLLLIQLGNGDQVEVTADVRAQMMNHARALPTAEVLRMMRAFNAAASDPRGGWSPSLGIELAFAEMLEQPTHLPPSSPPNFAEFSKIGGNQGGIPAQSGPVTSQNPAKLTESASQASAISFESVVKAWKQVAHLVKAKDANVAALLNSGKPLEIREGVLLVAFASDILNEKFNRPESLELTRNALREILGVNLPVQGIVTGGKNALPAHVKPDGMVAAALQNGGEIVDIQ